MAKADLLTDRFEASRAHLRAVAYRMLGSYTEADDAVQEAWLRADRADAGGIENVSGWLTTIVARICLDKLRTRRSRPEAPSGAHPPERTVVVGGEIDPADNAVVADSVGSGLLIVLDVLSPAERVAFVLHDIFAVPFDEIGQIVGRSPDAARQLASRARRRVQDRRVSPNWTSPVSERSSTPSSRPPVVATSTLCWCCSTPTSRSGLTTPPCA